MLTITTENTERQITMPKNPRYRQIREIYHEHNGVDGYRSMTVYLARKGIHYRPITIHKYMNKEMGLYAIVRPKKSEYIQGKPYKVFENKLAQNFTAERSNQKWCRFHLSVSEKW